MISKEAIKRIKDIINKYGTAMYIKYAGTEDISPEEVTDLFAQGILKPEDLERSVLDDAYLIGKLRGLLLEHEREKITPKEFHSKYINRLSVLSEAEKKSLGMAKESARNSLQAFKFEMGNKVIGALTSVNFDHAKQYLGEPVKNILEEAYIERTSLSKIIQQLKKTTGDFSRKWATVATTEMTKAINSGAADAIIEKNKDKTTDEIYVFFQVVRDPVLCKHCKRIFLSSDGTPRVFTMSDLIANGSNYGKKTHEWKASLTGLHINCRCTIAQIPDGWGFKPQSSRLTYIDQSHLQYKNQKKVKKS